VIFRNLATLGIGGAVTLALVLGGAGVAFADQVIADDLIVQGSVCVGLDCVNNEPFGFDTVVLKENNLRIFFNDTSVGAFPTNDWQIVVNDSASGGGSYFAIVDATAGQTLFQLCAVADTNCTNIGMGGTDPQTALNTSAIQQNTLDIGQNTADIAQNTSDIAQNTSDIAAINTQIGGFAEDIAANEDGVAIAIALGGIAPLMPDQNGTIAVNVGHFNGSNAMGLAGGFRLGESFVLNTGVG
jgi:hypothetical protein